jgi:hypothetical protein
MKLRAAVLFAAIPFLALFAQQQAPAPPVQSARQALIEMVTGGQKAVGKHLTVEVQQLMAKSGNKNAAMLSTFGTFPGQVGEAQTFETGPVLLSINQARDHSKVEVRVESDDLSGDEDTMDLSLHVVRENNDQQPEEWEAFFSHFTVNMKKQAGIWRLNKIAVGLEFPVGDPEFLQKTFLKGQEKASLSAAPSGGHEDPETDRPEVHIPPEQLVATVAMIEYSFARQHPEVGFSCSLPDLMESAKAFGLEQQLSSGIDQGYKLSLSGCQGRPAGSFQIIAEPTAHGNGGKAFCTDATRNVRVSDDGRGSTCLAFGRVPQRSNQDDRIRD